MSGNWRMTFITAGGRVHRLNLEDYHVAMGETMDDTLGHAEEALRDYVTETERDGARIAEASPAENVTPPEGSVLVAISLIRLRELGS